MKRRKFEFSFYFNSASIFPAVCFTCTNCWSMAAAILFLQANDWLVVSPDNHHPHTTAASQSITARPCCHLTAPFFLSTHQRNLVPKMKICSRFTPNYGSVNRINVIQIFVLKKNYFLVCCFLEQLHADRTMWRNRSSPSFPRENKLIAFNTKMSTNRCQVPVPNFTKLFVHYF